MGALGTDFFRPFVEATVKTLNVQCMIEVRPGDPFLKNDDLRSEFGIAGILGITSDAFNGTITICFPTKTYLTLMSNMLGETFTEIHEGLQDGAAELLNIIFGSAKVVLTNRGYSIKKAIPTVVMGKDIQTIHLSSKPVYVLPFETSTGFFHIEIASEDLKNVRS